MFDTIDNLFAPIALQLKFQPKECLFCKNNAKYFNNGRLENLGLNVYACHGCSAEYLYQDNGKLVMYSLYFFRDKKYKWAVTCSSRKSRIFEILDADCSDPTKQNFSLINEFYIDQDINPLNIKDILSEYLLWIFVNCAGQPWNLDMIRHFH